MGRASSIMTGRVSEVTLLTPIRPGLVVEDGETEGRTYEQRLSSALESVRLRVARGLPTAIGVMPTIHFARWLILRPAQYLQYSKIAPPPPRDHGGDPAAGAEATPPPHSSCRSWLFFTSDFDGDLKDYVREFAVFLAEDVDRIWGNCENWPEGGSSNFEVFWDYLKRHQIPTHALYAACPELTVGRIQQLNRFKRAFDEFVARTRRADGSTIEDVAPLLDEFLLRNNVYPRDFPRQGGTYAGDND